jgi:hemerythrin
MININPPIKLNPKDFKIGYDKIDQQHTEIIDAINELYVLRFNFSDEIHPVITKLKHHVDSHFRFEESLMEEYSYERAEEHKAEHDHMALISTRLIARFQLGEDIVEELQDFLFLLLLHHINKADRDLVKHCKKKGLT